MKMSSDEAVNLFRLAMSDPAVQLNLYYVSPGTCWEQVMGGFGQATTP